MIDLRKTLLFGFALIAMILSAACAFNADPVEMGNQTKTPPALPTDDPGTKKAPVVTREKQATVLLASPTEIKYTFGTRQLPKDLEMVEDALNDILIPAIHVKLKLDPIEDGVYDEKMRLRMAGREQCDIVFTSNWTNDYTINVINGSLRPLDDLLPTHAPGLWASIPDRVWEAVRVQGHIYAVINQQMWPRAWGVHVIKEYADKYSLDLETVHRFEDLEPFAQAILEGEGGRVTPYCRPSVPFYAQYNGIVGFKGGVAIPYDELTAVSVYELPEWQSIAKLSRKWLLAGYTFSEGVPDEQEQIKAKLCAFDSHVEYPGRAADLQTRYGLEWVTKNLTDPLILDRAGVVSSLNAVCATTVDPVAAVRVLELINTNKEVFRLLALGIEGVHYEYLDRELDAIQLLDGKNDADVGYAPDRDWQFGNQFLAPYRSKEAALADVWGESRELNERSVPHIALGFNFNYKPVETEIAQVQAVVAEFCMPILTGRIEFEGNYETCLEKTEAAGIKTILEEMQRQLDEWHASQPG